MSFPMMRDGPSRNIITVSTLMPGIDIKMDHVFGGIQHQVRVAHELLTYIVETMQRVLVVAWPLVQ